MQLIYLDYNATTPLAPAVQEALLPFLAEQYGNPSSAHTLGRAVRAAVEHARERVAGLIEADPDEVHFTSGGTESNNQALLGLAAARGGAQGKRIVVSAIEHPSVLEAARLLQRAGAELATVPVQPSGLVRPADVQRALSENTLLVSVHHAQGELGVVQPIREIARVCQAAGVPLHVDAAQSAGKLPVSVRQWQVDLLTIAGHKMYAPKGVGALYVRRGLAIEPLLVGGGQEGGLRSGTENILGIAGLGAAASLVFDHLTQAAHRMEALRDRLQALLEVGIGPGLLVSGREAARLPNTLHVCLPDVRSDVLLREIPELCASRGSACHREATVSPVLAALGRTPAQAAGAIRFSLGWYTTGEEVDRAANLVLHAWERWRDRGPA